MNNLLLPTRIHISLENMDRMLRDVTDRREEEACGLLSGTIETGSCKVVRVIPMQNSLHSPVRFLMDPKEQLETFDRIEAEGHQLVGIYHSHLKGPARPSRTDIAEAFYPEVVYLIWSKIGEDWQCHAFAIQDGNVYPVEMKLGSKE